MREIGRVYKVSRGLLVEYTPASPRLLFVLLLGSVTGARVLQDVPTKGTDPMNAPHTYEISDERVNMEEYGRNVPLWRRVWQNSLTQMLLLSMQAFCGPAMADAIAGE
jgi:hypothetical protein